jgi:hypothetical protein
MWKGQGKTADHRVDIYALGVIIFRALAGQLPFSNKSMQETLVAVTTAARPSLHALRPDLPPEVDEWVNQVLAVNIDDRFSSMGQTWAHLMWRLGAGPVPGSQVGATLPAAELDKIRLWLLEPPSDRHGSAQGVWATAATTLKRLIGRSAPSPRRGEPSRLIEVEQVKTSPPPQRPKAPLPAPRPTGPPLKTSPPPLPPQRKSAESGTLPAPKVRPEGVQPAASESDVPPDPMRARAAPPRPPRPAELVEAESVPPTTKGTLVNAEPAAAVASATVDTPTIVENPSPPSTAAAPTARAKQKRNEEKRKTQTRDAARRGGTLPGGPSPENDTRSPSKDAAAMTNRTKPKWKSRRHRKSK